jgi:DNA invertase Pin-like site-specific DNA recombinase
MAGRPAKTERNEAIKRLRKQGKSLLAIADQFNITDRRVWQIVHDQSSNWTTIVKERKLGYAQGKI